MSIKRVIMLNRRPDLCTNFIIDNKVNPNVKLTLTEVADKLNTTYMIVYDWFHRRGCKTIEDCRKRQEFLEKYPSGKVPKHVKVLCLWAIL